MTTIISALRGAASVVLLCGPVLAVTAAPSRADDPPAPMHHVRYTVTSASPIYADIYYLDQEPLGIILFTKELHRRYLGAGISAAAFHPGYVNSNFGPTSGSRFLAFMRRMPTTRLVPTTDRGADQLVWLAASTPGTDWRSGEYYSRHQIAKASRHAYDPGLARELWDRSLALIAT